MIGFVSSLLSLAWLLLWPWMLSSLAVCLMFAVFLACDQISRWA